jgi:hypothetical protein
MTRPLHKLTKEGDFLWDRDCQLAFEALRDALVMAPVLALPRDHGLFRLEMDASDVATGVVLYQEQDDGTFRPVGYYSKSYNEAEKNYTMYDKEMLGVMRGLEEWRSLLISVTHPFEIHTNHRNLVYFREPQKLTSQQVNWMAKLQEYNFVIKHISGMSNVPADTLSRPDGVEKALRVTNVLLPDRLFSRSLSGSEDGGSEPQEVDRERALAENHDSLVAGHPGVRRTLALLARRGHKWKGIRQDVRRYIQGCVACQKNKPRAGPMPGELHLLGVPGSPWEVMSWDMIGPLPESCTYNAIVTMVDVKTKVIKLEPADITITARGIMVIMKNRVFREEGLLAKVISDRGPQFVETL